MSLHDDYKLMAAKVTGLECRNLQLKAAIDQYARTYNAADHTIAELQREVLRLRMERDQARQAAAVLGWAACNHCMHVACTVCAHGTGKSPHNCDLLTVDDGGNILGECHFDLKPCGAEGKA